MKFVEMDAIFKIADKHNLEIYEDSAQALGAKYLNQNSRNIWYSRLY